MGQAVAKNVGDQAGAAQGQLNKAKTGFANASSAGATNYNAFDAQHSTADSAQANADKAAAGYSGPQSLNDTDPTLAGNVGEAASRVNAAKTEDGLAGDIAQTYGASGASGGAGGALNSFLLSGSAGGAGAMDDLQKQYGHLGDEYGKAESDSAKAAEKAAADTSANATKWGDVASQKRAEADKQAQLKAGIPKPVPKTQAESSNMMWGVDPKNLKDVAARKDEIAKYTMAMQMTTQEQMDQSFEDFNSVMSPTVIAQNWAGKQDMTQKAAQDAYGGLSLDGKDAKSSASGSTTKTHIPWDRFGAQGFWVWRQMTPDQWADLNSKPANGPNGMQAWIATRADQLRNGHGTYDRNRKGY